MCLSLVYVDFCLSCVGLLLFLVVVVRFYEKRRIDILEILKSVTKKLPRRGHACCEPDNSTTSHGSLPPVLDLCVVVRIV